MDKISALMDGELDEPQARQEYARLRQNGELRQIWDTFHVIGDALRGERLLLTDVAGVLLGALGAAQGQPPTAHLGSGDDHRARRDVPRVPDL